MYTGIIALMLGMATIEDPLERKRVEPAIWKYQELKEICACESMGQPDIEPQHFDADGNVLRGRINPDDTGACQINAYFHKETAESMGLNLEKEKDNIAYAHWLYEQQGAQPWSWSKHCHGH